MDQNGWPWLAAVTKVRRNLPVSARVFWWPTGTTPHESAEETPGDTSRFRPVYSVRDIRCSGAHRSPLTTTQKSKQTYGVGGDAHETMATHRVLPAAQRARRSAAAAASRQRQGALGCPEGTMARLARASARQLQRLVPQATMDF